MISRPIPGRSVDIPAISREQAVYAVQIREAAVEFEKMLLRQMMREIRSGSLMPQAAETRGYMDIADDQLADVVSKSGGMGLGNAMAEQFLRQIGVARSIR